MSEELSIEYHQKLLNLFINAHAYSYIFLGSSLEHILASDNPEAAKRVCYDALVRKCEFVPTMGSQQKVEEDIATIFSSLVDGFAQGPCRQAVLSYGECAPPGGTWAQIKELLAGEREDLDSPFIERFAAKIMNGLGNVFNFHWLILQDCLKNEPDIKPDLRSAFERLLDFFVAANTTDQADSTRHLFLMLSFWDALLRSSVLTKDLLDSTSQAVPEASEDVLVAYRQIRQQQSEEKLQEMLIKMCYSNARTMAEFELFIGQKTCLPE